MPPSLPDRFHRASKLVAALEERSRHARRCRGRRGHSAWACFPSPGPLLDLETLLREPHRVEEVPLDRLPGLLKEARALVADLETRVLAALLNGEGSPASRAQPEDRLLNIQQAAAKLDVSKDWLYRRSSKLPFVVRLGRPVRYSERGIEKYIRARIAR